MNEIGTIANRSDIREAAKTLKITNRLVIGGRSTDCQSGDVTQLISPIDGRIVGDTASGAAADVDAAVRNARQVFESGAWSGRSPRERKLVLVRLAELIERNTDGIALLDTVSMGMPITLGRSFCVPWAINAFRWFGEAVDKIYDEIAPSASNVLAMIRREPIGVVGAVLPWNWPTGLLAWKVAPALAAGNSVVVKPDEKSSASAIRIAELALEAGVPEGVFNVVTGGPAAGEALGRHPDVDVITFTGSGEVGRRFQLYASESNMKPVWLECGGKGASVVFPDAPNMEALVRGVAGGVFVNGGQVCASGSRLIVHADMKDRLLEAVLQVLPVFGPGDPLDESSLSGPLASAEQLRRVEGYVSLGVQEGATVCAGGRRAFEETGGFYMQPTIFDDVRPHMTIANEEIFGPVLSVLTFTAEDEALRIANGTSYGLAAAVWTSDFSRAHRMANAIRAGSVSINNYNEDAHQIEVPFGGCKQSGYGRDKSLHSIEKYQQMKTIWASH